MKVALCVPTVTKPYEACLDAMEAAVPVAEAAGHEVKFVQEVGNPYIGGARATMLRKALDDRCDAALFIDHDVAFRPEDLLALIEAPADVVAGTYRFKKPDEEYMGEWVRDAAGKPVGQAVGDLVMLRATKVPAGFLKVTKEAVDRLMGAYPELCYGPRYSPSIDLFNHGAHERVFWGEDYAFSRRWIECGGDLWLLPELQITHHASDGTAFPGDLHEYLQRQPGGAKDPAREQSAA